MSNIGQVFPINPFVIPGITKGIAEISDRYIRPEDSTNYANNDALSDSISTPSPLIFANTSRAEGGSGYIVNAACYTNQLVFVGALRLHLFKGSVPNAIADNAPYPMLAVNNSKRIAYIDFTSFTTGGVGSDTTMSCGVFPQSRLIPFTCDLADTNLYGLVEIRTGFAPMSNQTFDFYLGVEQN
ncbi:hypothetical protein FD723_39695 (plasmid) [Nostoc sp. C052]|uniref:hypothetical protein n=1 Tax=Nostoc sp. C052 TaxID=2576902 RepID=UPI0015C308F6|nr:hypothetical protein [Nostoc sp. C052]QLE46336.1 hypothetical protein FD723_39695 [Nostoc sp. C052]